MSAHTLYPRTHWDKLETQTRIEGDACVVTWTLPMTFHRVTHPSSQEIATGCNGDALSG